MAGPATYPNELDPADATVLALDGTVDAPTGLAYIAKGVGPNSTPTYEIQYNRRLLRMNGVLAAVRQGMVVDEGSLKIGVYPISYELGGVRDTFDGATGVAVPDDATRVVYLDGGNVLQIQASVPADPSTYLLLATVSATAGVLTILDNRPPLFFSVAQVGPTVMSIPMTPSVQLSGALSVKVWEIEWTAPVAFTLRHAIGRVNTAPVGADLIVDVRVNGASVFSQQSDMIVIVDGGQQDTSATVNHAVAAGDVLTFEVEQVGSTTPGSDLTVVLNGLTSLDTV